MLTRLGDIKNTVQHDRTLLDREPSCNTTHHVGCDCQVQRHIKEKVDLIAIIDRLLAENKALVEAAEPIITRIDREGVYLKGIAREIYNLKEALDKLIGGGK